MSENQTPESTDEILSFDAYPPLEAVVRGGGFPGVSYAYILGKNMANVRKSDSAWKICHYARDFMVKDEAFIVLTQGTPITGASPTSCIPELFVDSEADKILGVKPYGKKKEETSPQAAA